MLPQEEDEATTARKNRKKKIKENSDVSPVADLVAS